MSKVQLLKLPGVLALRAKGRTRHYANVEEGLFPPPIKRGYRDVVWRLSEVESINAAEIAGHSRDEIRALVVRLTAERTHSAEAFA